MFAHFFIILLDMVTSEGVRGLLTFSHFLSLFHPAPPTFLRFMILNYLPLHTCLFFQLEFVNMDGQYFIYNVIQVITVCMKMCRFKNLQHGYCHS